jgi:hypothetical protein
MGSFLGQAGFLPQMHYTGKGKPVQAGSETLPQEKFGKMLKKSNNY